MSSYFQFETVIFHIQNEILLYLIYFLDFERVFCYEAQSGLEFMLIFLLQYFEYVHVSACLFPVLFFIFIYSLRKSLVVTFSRLALNLEPFCLNSQVLGLPVSVPGLNSVLRFDLSNHGQSVLFLFLNGISKKE